MKNPEIPSTFTLNPDKNISFNEINRRFSDSKYGQKLATEIRYKDYNLTKISPEDWQTLLGVDVNNLKHLSLTYELTRVFLKYSGDKYTQEEQQKLLLTAIIHDWGEARTTDITYEKKNKNDEKIEIIALRQIAREIFSDNSQLCDQIDDVVDNILTDRSTKLGQTFNAIERLGYLRTGLRALKESSNIENQPQRSGLNWLTSNVLLNQIPTLIQYSQIYPVVNEYLSRSKEIITTAFQKLPPTMFDHYEPEKIDERRTQYQNAKQKWQNFVLNNFEQQRQNKKYQEILSDFSEYGINYPQQIPIAIDSARGLLKRSYFPEEIIEIHTRLMKFSYESLVDPDYRQKIDKNFVSAISFRRDLSRYFWEIAPLVYSVSHDYKNDSLNLLESAAKFIPDKNDWRRGLIIIEKQNKLAKLGRRINLDDTINALNSLSKNSEVSLDTFKAVSTWSSETALLSSPLTVLKDRKFLIALGRLTNESLHDFCFKKCRYNLSPDYLDTLSNQLDNIFRNWVK